MGHYGRADFFAVNKDIMFNLKNAQFDYEPYPICFIPEILDPAFFQELAESYPSRSLFNYSPEYWSQIFPLGNQQPEEIQRIPWQKSVLATVL